jgi:hypothetical protein
VGGRTEFEFRAKGLQSKCSTAWATPPIHFAVVILEMRILQTLPSLSSNHIPPNLSFPRS